MLGRVAGQRERAATGGTRRRQRRLVVLVDACRRWSMRLPSVRRARLAARSTRWPTRRPAREGRRLPMERAARLVEIVLEPVDFLAQLIAVAAVPIAIPIGPLVLSPQALILSLQSLEFGDQFLASGRVPSRVHAPVMARLRNLYRYDFLDRAYG